jgi:hypothetical protein
VSKYDNGLGLDPYYGRRRSRRGSVPLRVGLITSGLVILTQLMLAIIGRENALPAASGIAVLLFKWFLYVIATRVAARQQFQINQQQSLEPMVGVRGAAVGTAYIVATLSWIGAIVAALIFDTVGFIAVNPVALFCAVVIDFVLAGAIAAWTTHDVARRNTDTSQSILI